MNTSPGAVDPASRLTAAQLENAPAAALLTGLGVGELPSRRSG